MTVSEPQYPMRLFPKPESKAWSPKGKLSAKDYIEKFRPILFMTGGEGPNEKVPAGYTYLGQFIAHELSFDLSGSTDIRMRYSSSKLRTPKFDLDSVYGGGPLVAPFYYNQTLCNGRTHFDLGSSVVKLADKEYTIFDLPRSCQKKEKYIPIIPDVRNDENLVISQLHVAVMLFHNRMVDEELKKIKKEFNPEQYPEICKEHSNLLLDQGMKFANYYRHGFRHHQLKKENKIEDYYQYLLKTLRSNLKELESLLYSEKNTDEAQLYEAIIKVQDVKNTIWDLIFLKVKQEVQWHFQWIILHDFLPRILGHDLIVKLLGKPICNDFRGIAGKVILKLFEGRKPFMPIEFSSAAFRFGHSMVVGIYNFSEEAKDKGIFDVKQPNQKPTNFYIDWSLFFFKKQEPENGISPNKSRLIDLFIQIDMNDRLPFDLASRNITFRNLARSIEMELPSGQDIAVKMNVKPVKSDEFKESDGCASFENLALQFPHLGDDGLGTKEKDLTALCDDSPLWFYILMEAFTRGKGENLGPVGGRIVGETLLGLLKEDLSAVIYSPSDWLPIFYSESGPYVPGGDNSMIHFLEYAGVYNGAFVDKKGQCEEEN